jgi:xeroderma pigmentosum group C-complementing protein
MSFYWNLSSEDELEGEDEDELDQHERGDQFQAVQSPALGCSPPKETVVSPVAVTVATVAPCVDDDVFSDDEDDEVDWEDADDEEEAFEEEDSKPAAAPLRPITINIGKKKLDDRFSKNKKKTKRTRTRKIYRNKSLSPGVGQLLRNLHKAHALALSTRAVMISECCSNEDLLHLSHSLVSLEISSSAKVPSLDQVKKLCTWYFNFVNRVDQRRRARLRSNAAAGATTRRKRDRKRTTAHGKSGQYYTPPPKVNGHGTVTPLLLMQLCSYLSSLNDENPQLDTETGNYRITSLDKVQLLIVMARSFGWRARYVVSLDPMSQDFDVNHPMFFFGTVANVFDVVHKKSSKRAKISKQQKSKPIAPVVEENPGDGIVAWVEILCQGGRNNMKWTHVDVENEWIDQPRSVESLIYSKKNDVNLNLKRHTHITYALGVEHLVKETDKTVFRVTDVTPRYANSWSKSQRLRGDECSAWFSETIRKLNVAGGTTSRKKQRHVSSGENAAEAITIEDLDEETNQDAEMPPAQAGDEVEEAEKAELSESAAQETMPTSKAGFKNHAAYALLSQLGTYEVFDPNAKKSVCGMFKGELVHRRSDVRTAKVAKKWLYEGRKVKDGEKPVKRVKARKKAAPKMFRQLDSYGVGASNDGSEDFRQRQIEVGSAPESDGKEDLFAFWQTASWSPPYVGPNDDIPVNAYRNIELALLNPGLVHMDRLRMAQVAKKLGM